MSADGTVDWVDVAAVADLDAGAPVLGQLGPEPIVLVQARDGKIRALGAVCSHAGGPLEKGRVVDHNGEDCLQCPWHASLFRLIDGSVVRGPASSQQPVYDVRTVADRLQVRRRG